MPRLPKHLREMEPNTLKQMQEGFNRFRFGFAQPGEMIERDGSLYTFIGNFKVKKMAQEVAESQSDYMQPGAKGVAVHPYLNGRNAVGWSVYHWDHRN